MSSSGQHRLEEMVIEVAPKQAKYLIGRTCRQRAGFESFDP